MRAKTGYIMNEKETVTIGMQLQIGLPY